MMFLTFLAALAIAGRPEAVLGSKSDAKAMQGMHEYGRCVANEWTGNTRTALALDFRTKAYERAIWNLADKPVRCEGADFPNKVMESATLLFAGALAEGLLRRDGTTDDLAAKTAHNPALPDIDARNAGELTAFCVVRANPAGVAELLKTDPATNEELAALKAMGPTLSGCVPANSKSEFTRDALRALLALGAYRLALYNQQGRPHA